MKDLGADVLGIQEHNLNLKIMKGRLTWKSRFRKWHRYVTTAAWNIHTSSKEKHLFGGTAIFVGPNYYNKVGEAKPDDRGMGRWTTVVLQGQHQRRLRIISAYRPVTDSSNRPSTVFSQQEAVLLEHGDTRNPRSALFEDLQKHILRWQEEGDMIILGMDANENVRRGPASFARRCNLISVMDTEHPQLPMTATCNKNQSDIAVDGIWCSPGLDIVQCGMTGFGEIQVGRTDHRVLWVDISEFSAFGYQPPKAPYKQPERLNIKDPKVLKRYTSIAADMHHQSDTTAKLIDIIQQFNDNGVTQDTQDRFDSMVKFDFLIRKKARRKCRKLKMGEVPFSDEIQTFHRKLHMWTLIASVRNGNRVDSRKIRRLMKQVSVPDAMTKSLKQAILEKRKTFKDYRKIKKKGEEKRKEFQKRVNIRRAKKYGTSLQAQEKITQASFRSKNAHARVGAVTGKQRTAISYVSDGVGDDIQHHYGKQAIETALEKEGAARFLQAYDTDMTIEPLVSDFPTIGGDNVDSVLAGTYECPDGTDTYAKKFLNQLQLLPGVPLEGDIAATFSVDDHIQGWSRMKSKTNSSPFGNSFLDHIAACDERELARIDALMGFIPYATGIIPKEWLHVMDSMIPKKKESKHVSKMRMIVLFHALNNFQNKHFARRMMASIEKKGAVPLEASGSRKGYRAIDCAVNKVFTTDLIRQWRLTAALCSNDAKSCYDRILHVIAELCMRRTGLTKEVCYMMLGSLEEMHHHIRTVYGDAAHSYTAVALPFQGVYQGNGAGPAIWLVVSMPIIQMLKAEGFGFKSVTPISGTQYDLVCYTFVDDTDLVHCLPAGNNDVEQLVREMQSMIDHWGGGIRVTGGDLVPSKSYYFLMTFYNKNDRWHYKPKSQLPGSLAIHDINGNARELERLDVSEARETLGAWIAMDGNSDSQYEALEVKILEWGNKVRSGALTSTDALLGLRSRLSKSLQYPLAASTIPRARLKKLTSTLMKMVLPAIGIPLSYPRNVLHSPDDLLGYQLPCVDVDAGFYQAELLLRNIQGDKLTSFLGLDSLETLQLELGVSGNIFALPFKKWKAIATPCWMVRFWEFCSNYGFEFWIPSTTIPLLRAGDCFLMNTFVEAGYKGEELHWLNICRKWHKVLRLSEIVTGDGKWITTAARKAGPAIGRNEYRWPEEHKPSSRCWTLWNSALDICFLDQLDRSKKLRQPLGSWTTVPTTWEWMISPSEDRVFWRQDDRIKYFVSNNGRTRRQRYSIHGDVQTLPVDAVPTTCFGNSHTVRHEGFHTVQNQPQARQEQQWWNQRILGTETRIPAFFAGVAAGTAVIICDGSFKDDWGTAAVIAAPDINSFNPVISVHITPGMKKKHNPYRAELAGILAGIISVEKECGQYEVVEGTITIGCDCDSALRAFRACLKWQPSSSEPDYDIKLQMYELLRNSTFTWLSKEITGHQDDLRPYWQLTVWEQWNVDADYFAKAHWSHQASVDFYHLPPLHEVSIWHKGHRVTTWSSKEVYRRVFQEESESYWIKKLNVDEPETIDFETMGKTFKGTQIYKRLWLSKALTERLPTSTNVTKWSHEEVPDMCHRCGQPEDAQHATWCQAPSARGYRKECITTIEEHLRKQHTAPSLRRRIISILRDEVIPRTLAEDGDITKEMLSQGLILKSWIATQQRYYEWLKRRTTGKRWAQRLITQLWEMSWNMWTHRAKIADSKDSMQLPQHHTNLNALIKFEYETQHANPNRLLHRRFSRPLPYCMSQNIHWKQQWLDAVTKIRAACTDE